MDDSLLQLSVYSKTTVKRKPRKQGTPRRRVMKQRRLVFDCSPDCICLHCEPSLVLLPGTCVLRMMDFLPRWPRHLTVAQYGCLIGERLNTNDRTSYWWTGVVRDDSILDRVQYNTVGRYTMELKKRTPHPLREAIARATMRRIPWTLCEEDVWDVIPDAIREVTLENQDRVDGILFFQVARKEFTTHVFKIELQMEQIVLDGVCELSPMSWRFSVRPRWLFACQPSVNFSGVKRKMSSFGFHSPDRRQRVIVGERKETFQGLCDRIMEDKSAWRSPIADVQFRLGEGFWLPYRSFVKGIYSCKSCLLEQYFHVGIVESEYEYSPGFVGRLQYAGDSRDLTIPLMECLPDIKGADGRRILMIKQFSLRNGLATRACETIYRSDTFLTPELAQDVFYI